MADFTRREVVTTRVEFVLRSPTNWVEVDKAFTVIRRELGEEARWDDAAWIEARDDEVVVYYEKSKVVKPS